MIVTIGILKLKIKYTYRRGDATIYQRAIPTDLRDRYPGPHIKKTLPTVDPVEVVRLVTELNKQVEAEWEGLRAAPGSSPKALQVHAEKFLQDWGLKPGKPDHDPVALDLLMDHIDTKRQAWAMRQDDPEEAYEEAASTDYLTPVEIEAGKLLHGIHKPRLSDALEFCLQTHKKCKEEAFRKYQTRAMDALVAVIGDKEIEEVKREDVRRFIETSLKQGHKTASVRRMLNSQSAVLNHWIKENTLNMVNPFKRVDIPGEGEDTEKRQPYTQHELNYLYTECRVRDDALRWMISMIIDTGARLAEVVGLRLSDIDLTHEVPHIVITKTPQRRLKNAGSERRVPLVGASLWAAQRVMDTAQEGQVFAFPRYTDDKKCRADRASAACGVFLKSIKLDHNLHELRHTLADRLRNVECPRDVRFAIEGHSSQDVGDQYGDGHSLKTKQRWLLKIALSGDEPASATDAD